MKSQKASLALLDPHASDEPFPPVEMAWKEPNGLLALGGDLSPTRLINAYSAGIFPWYNPDEPIYWWSPDPRAVLFPHKIKLRRSLRKTIRSMQRKGYTICFDRDFAGVVSACAAPRKNTGGTWISNEMNLAYQRMHELGVAHSVEVWNPDNQLVGGLYGVATGGIFSGESMFSIERDTSKIAFIALAWHLQQWGYTLIDCQIENSHLVSMGSENIPRDLYVKILEKAPFPPAHDWTFSPESDLSHWKPGGAHDD
jgi:leucyl/phenylalanyl-tRNA--protein transferase